MDIKIISNFGFWDGQSGKGVLYVALTPGQTYLAAFKMLVDGVEEYRYLRKSQIESGLNQGDMKVANDFKMELLTDQADPEWATGTGTLKKITTIVNGDDLPRLLTLENPYTLKGEGITSSDIDKLKSTSNTPGAGVDTPTTPATNKGILGGLIPENFDGLFKNPLQFIQDNPMFIALVVGLVYFFRRKKKKPLWFI